MTKFCKYCGKVLSEGRLCDCKASADANQRVNSFAESNQPMSRPPQPQQPYPGGQEQVVQQQSGSGMPPQNPQPQTYQNSVSGAPGQPPPHPGTQGQSPYAGTQGQPQQSPYQGDQGQPNQVQPPYGQPSYGSQNAYGQNPVNVSNTGAGGEFVKDVCNVFLFFFKAPYKATSDVAKRVNTGISITLLAIQAFLISLIPLFLLSRNLGNYNGYMTSYYFQIFFSMLFLTALFSLMLAVFLSAFSNPLKCKIDFNRAISCVSGASIPVSLMGAVLGFFSLLFAKQIGNGFVLSLFIIVLFASSTMAACTLYALVKESIEDENKALFLILLSYAAAILVFLLFGYFILDSMGNSMASNLVSDINRYF